MFPLPCSQVAASRMMAHNSGWGRGGCLLTATRLQVVLPAMHPRQCRLPEGEQLGIDYGKHGLTAAMAMPQGAVEKLQQTPWQRHGRQEVRLWGKTGAVLGWLGPQSHRTMPPSSRGAHQGHGALRGYTRSSLLYLQFKRMHR